MADTMTAMRYERTGRVARVTLSRPEHGNAITERFAGELAACVEKANLDRRVHCILLSGDGSGFCGGYDLGLFAEGMRSGDPDGDGEDQPIHDVADPRLLAVNHDPARTWDPMLDYQWMSRNVRAFMSLARSDKPVICKVHGFCVAGGTDLALCSDLLVIAEDAKIGYPPARVWGSPTTALWAQRIGAQRAARLLFTGDCLTGREAAEWGLAIEAAPASELDERCEALVERIARVPVNQLIMMKLLIRESLEGGGLHSQQVLGTILDGITRHTEEGYAFQQRAASAGWREAVRERDEPFGDLGLRGSGVTG
jgi:enoyl-CoA hydratase